MDATLVSPLRSTALIGRGVFIELIRRKDVYVLLFLMMVFLIGVSAIRMVGIEQAATGTFLLNLGMSLAFYAAHILTLLLMARQIPDEMEHRTLYPLLAKPVERDVLLLAKWLACAVCGAGVLGVLMLLGWLPVPRLEVYHPGTGAQMLTLLPVSLALLAGITLCLSLLVPQGVTLVISGGLFFAGPHLLALVRRVAADQAVWQPAVWLSGYLPDFGKLNLITRYTDGIAPLGMGEFTGLLAYGALFTALSLALSAALFRRRPL